MISNYISHHCGERAANYCVVIRGFNVIPVKHLLSYDSPNYCNDTESEGGSIQLTDAIYSVWSSRRPLFG